MPPWSRTGRLRAEMDRLSVQCRNGHDSIEVIAFVRRSEEEVLDKLLTAPEPPSEAALQRVAEKAGKWVIDNEADRSTASLPARGGKVFPKCNVCGLAIPANGVGWQKLRPALDRIAATGVATTTMEQIADVLRFSSTQRRP